MLPLCGSNQKAQIPAFVVTKLTQGFEEDGVGRVLPMWSKDAHRANPRPRGLRFGGERRNEKQDGQYGGEFGT